MYYTPNVLYTSLDDTIHYKVALVVLLARPNCKLLYNGRLLQNGNALSSMFLHNLAMRIYIVGCKQVIEPCPLFSNHSVTEM